MDAQTERVWRRLREVPDPELPFLNIVEMGMVRGVRWTDGQLSVSISPTYSGCPATDFIKEDVERVVRMLDPSGEVEIVLSPAWSTDDLEASALEKMRANGIAPPTERTSDKLRLKGQHGDVACPRCGSGDTEMVSAFGSTACKALYKCRTCLEPFDHFKCL